MIGYLCVWHSQFLTLYPVPPEDLKPGRSNFGYLPGDIVDSKPYTHRNEISFCVQHEDFIWEGSIFGYLTISTSQFLTLYPFVSLYVHSSCSTQAEGASFWGQNT